MDKERQKLLTDETNQILRERIEFMQKQYPAVRDAYQTHYNWPELDSLRHEISLCITLGLFQAAITLTNHLLESLLKYALIIHHAEGNEPKAETVRGRLVTSLVERYEEGRKRYGNAIRTFPASP